MGQHAPSQKFETPERARELSLFESKGNSSEVPLNKKKASFSPTSAGDGFSGKAPKKLTIAGVFDEGRSLKRSEVGSRDPNKRLVVPCIQHKDFNHIPY